MKLLIAGGVGEHGRNCFMCRGSGAAFWWTVEKWRIRRRIRIPI